MLHHLKLSKSCAMQIEENHQGEFDQKGVYDDERAMKLFDNERKKIKKHRSELFAKNRHY